MVRGCWKTYDGIKLEQVNKAPYLLAALLHLPAGLERSPPCGANISDHHLPEQTSV